MIHRLDKFTATFIFFFRNHSRFFEKPIFFLISYSITYPSEQQLLLFFIKCLQFSPVILLFKWKFIISKYSNMGRTKNWYVCILKVVLLCSKFNSGLGHLWHAYLALSVQKNSTCITWSTIQSQSSRFYATIQLNKIPMKLGGGVQENVWWRGWTFASGRSKLTSRAMDRHCKTFTLTRSIRKMHFYSDRKMMPYEYSVFELLPCIKSNLFIRLRALFYFFPCKSNNTSFPLLSFIPGFLSLNKNATSPWKIESVIAVYRCLRRTFQSDSKLNMKF